jgi:hypothetical protein
MRRRMAVLEKIKSNIAHVACAAHTYPLRYPVAVHLTCAAVFVCLVHATGAQKIVHRHALTNGVSLIACKAA